MPSESPTKVFRVAIIGGGMCGLACAVGLARRGIPKFDEVGAGVGSVRPNALRALQGIGVLDAVLAQVDDAERTARQMLYVSGHGEHEEVYDYDYSSQFTQEDNGIGIYRPTFLAAVLPLVDPSTTHFNKRCTSISTSATGAHVIHFADGTTHETELVIGADGIKSATRNAVVGDRKVLQFTNSVADGVKTDLSKRLLCFVGIDKHIITFPIKSGKIINIVAFATNSAVPIGSVDSVSQQELLDEYAGWGADPLRMLRRLTAPSKWSIHALAPLDTFVRGRITLVGDAAHAMPPHLGSGVGQGFEDVLVLCELLAHPRRAVLKAYDAVRQPRANMVLERSFRAAGVPRGRHGGHLAGIWEPIWRHDLDGDHSFAES
ncbi:FAD/NAD(P)-binding domain-containing protein [Mycena sp. CBHHK59/15]|nr:FAD/NAD(P)-binding domain-containing protein [Mycena sp. CBHHK59/15]